MVEQIRKPSAPSNYAKNKVDDQISLHSRRRSDGYTVS